mmetsp:Transcript_133410/g.426478  ORF Transcript_133410/g.426478 Transcript_133410/m.426478 type:complete len:241 (-) Transcript_133410:47-769(-)
MLASPDDGGKHGTRSILSGEACIDVLGAKVDHDGTHLAVLSVVFIGGDEKVLQGHRLCDLLCDRRVDGDVLQGLLPSRLASGAVLVEHGPRHRIEARLPTCSELAAGAVLCLDLLVSGFRCSGAFLVDLLLLPCSGTAHRIVARAHALVEPRLEAGRRAHRACTSGRDTLVLQGACELEKSADELRGACAGLLGLLRPGLSLLLGTIGDAIVHLVLVDVLGLLDGADEEHIAAELHRCKG